MAVAVMVLRLARCHVEVEMKYYRYGMVEGERAVVEYRGIVW